MAEGTPHRSTQLGRGSLRPSWRSARTTQVKKEINDVLVRFDRTLLVAYPRCWTPKKFGGRGAKAKFCFWRIRYRRQSQRKTLRKHGLSLQSLSFCLILLRRTTWEQLNVIDSSISQISVTTKVELMWMLKLTMKK